MTKIFNNYNNKYQKNQLINNNYNNNKQIN